MIYNTVKICKINDFNKKKRTELKIAIKDSAISIIKYMNMSWNSGWICKYKTKHLPININLSISFFLCYP